MTSLYRQILKRAWHITRKFKYLWPLGIFAAFLGNGGEYQVLFKQINNVNYQADIATAWNNNLNTILPALDLSAGNIFSVLLGLLFGIAILVLLLWLVISSLGGLIKGSAAADKEERYTFGMLPLTSAPMRKPWGSSKSLRTPIIGIGISSSVAMA